MSSVPYKNTLSFPSTPTIPPQDPLSLGGHYFPGSGVPPKTRSPASAPASPGFCPDSLQGKQRKSGSRAPTHRLICPVSRPLHAPSRSLAQPWPPPSLSPSGSRPRPRSRRSASRSSPPATGTRRAQSARPCWARRPPPALRPPTLSNATGGDQLRGGGGWAPGEMPRCAGLTLSPPSARLPSPAHLAPRLCRVSADTEERRLSTPHHALRSPLGCGGGLPVHCPSAEGTGRPEAVKSVTHPAPRHFSSGGAGV